MSNQYLGMGDEKLRISLCVGFLDLYDLRLVELENIVVLCTGRGIYLLL